jgi:hypothetical protein
MGCVALVRILFLEGESMLKKILSVVLVGLLVNVAGMTGVHAGQQQDRQARAMEKVKENVRKLGTGRAARIEARLMDGSKVSGYIREAGDESFVVVDEKTGAATTVVYSQVKQAKGRNRLTAAKVGITVAKGAAIVAGVAAAFTLLTYIFVSQTK